MTEFWEQFGIKAIGGLRYKANKYKGLYWHLFSIMVRKRDFKKYGRCISCGKMVNDWRQLQAGHYVAAGQCGFDLLFDEKNVNGECEYCNGFDQTHMHGYAKGLDERYGLGTADSLMERYRDVQFRGNTTKEWNTAQYKEKIMSLLSTPDIIRELKLRDSKVELTV